MTNTIYEEYAKKFMEDLVAFHPAQPEFHQAVQEVVDSLGPCLERNPKYLEAKILERMVEPDRVIIFRRRDADYRDSLLQMRRRR